MKFIKKPVVVEATQWFKNGDHPLDYTSSAIDVVEGAPRVVTARHRMLNNWEGEVVRYYRSPERDGEVQCQHCGKTMHVHGWIDTLEGGHIVCPGDWVITGVKGERYPCKPDVFAATYEPADTEAPGTKSLASEGAAAALSDEACEKIAHQARRGDMAQRRVEELERELASLHESQRKIDADAGGCALSCDGTGCNTMSELAISKARASELEDLLPGAAWFIRRCLSIYPAERRPLAEYMARQIEAAMRGEGSIGASPLLAKIEAQDAEIKQLKEKIDLLGTAGAECGHE